VLEAEEEHLFSKRNTLLAVLQRLQEANTSAPFYPDANGTLRFSAGHVEGYQPADAVTYAPVTTVGGILDKHAEAMMLGQDTEEFTCPERLLAMTTADPTLLTTPVNLLYSTDTVGGNSGSPVLDANGRFVAINFDRQRQVLTPYVFQRNFTHLRKGTQPLNCWKSLLNCWV